MSQPETGAAETNADAALIAVKGVMLSAKERKITWTPWPALNVARTCLSLLIQVAPAFFWIAAAMLHLPKQAFLVILFVGIGYGVAYLALGRLIRRLSKVSVLEGQGVDWLIDASGVRRTSSLFDTRIERQGFVSVTEDKTRFLFFTSSQIAIVLPKRCLSADQIASLRSLTAAWR